MSDNLEPETPQNVVPHAESRNDGASIDFAEILEQVICAAKTDPEASAQDLELRQQLRAIAVRFAGQQLTLNPVLVSLVEVVNARSRFLTADQKSGMNQAVAKTLYEDSESRVRLETLWHSLGESAR